MYAYRRHSRSTPRPCAQRGAASPWIFAGFLAVAGFFIFTEHRAHLMGAWPFILLALCPLMHLFHGRHGHGRGADPNDERSAPAGNDAGRAAPPTDPRLPHSH